MTARIVLITHPETNWNEIGRYQGHLDVPLNPHGRSVALICGYYLSTHNISAVYSSDLYRAFEAGRIIAGQCSLTKVIADSRLREGRWEQQDGLYEYPLLSFSKSKETILEVAERMNDVLAEIAKRHNSKTVVVVSHSGSVRYFIERQLKLNPVPKLVYTNDQTAINMLIYSKNKWVIESLNDLSYLDSI